MDSFGGGLPEGSHHITDTGVERLKLGLLHALEADGQGFAVVGNVTHGNFEEVTTASLVGPY